MGFFELEPNIVDQAIRDGAVDHFRKAGIRLPTLSELSTPHLKPAAFHEALAEVDPDAPDPRNLYRVHWFNSADRRHLIDVPEHLVLPPELTGVAAPIVVALGSRFPMIGAHKVLAAYGCLVPRLVTGRFDPTTQRAVWPSTGNYCRGGVAISRILGCRGVAVLPEGMSQERFDWLNDWVSSPADIVRTPGSESNVKEIYDACHQLEQDKDNVIFNQFNEFGNHLAHYAVTGRALGVLYESLQMNRENLRLRAFVSATGSAGTIAAGDFLKALTGSLTVAVEALECPTLLYCGYGEHNIQGIGDKHVPFIHNVMGTDMVVGVSDASSDHLFLLFNTEAGRDYLVSRVGLTEGLVTALSGLGFSGICNVLAAIKTARYMNYGPDDAIITVATDSADMYQSEITRLMARDYSGGFDPLTAARVYGQHLAGVATDHLLELTHRDKARIFNQAYFTWVEQQGISLEDFEARRSPAFWDALHGTIPLWDELIQAFNQETGVGG